MRTLMVAAALFFCAGEANAISRYVSTSMTCAKVKETVTQQGAVILQHKSPRTGVLLYDRYVKDRRFCAGGETTEWASVPTKDQKSCRVDRCAQIEFFDLR